MHVKCLFCRNKFEGGYVKPSKTRTLRGTISSDIKFYCEIKLEKNSAFTIFYSPYIEAALAAKHENKKIKECEGDCYYIVYRYKSRKNTILGQNIIERGHY